MFKQARAAVAGWFARHTPTVTVNVRGGGVDPDFLNVVEGTRMSGMDERISTI